MNLQKVKDALCEIVNQDQGTWDKPVSFGVLYTRIVDIARDALTELESEKPDEDLELLSIEIEGYLTSYESLKVPSVENVKKISVLIQQYADSYHAKKCAECKKTCEWVADSEGLIETSCGLAWECTNGTYKENGMEYCPKCGGKITDPFPDAENRPEASK